MRVLQSLARQQGELLQLAARAFGTSAAAAADVAVASPFLRYSNPYPANIDHTPLLSSIPETQVTTLPNGLRVATEANPFAETATTRTVKDLEVEIENMGGSLNAYTGREQTCYYAKAGCIQLKVFFGFAQQAVFQYGLNNTVAVAGNSTKFNIEVVSWPFCNAANKLVVELQVSTGNRHPYGKPVNGGGELVTTNTGNMMQGDPHQDSGDSQHALPNRSNDGQEGDDNHEGPRDPRVADKPRHKFALLASNHSATAVSFSMLPYAYDAENGTQLLNVSVGSFESDDLVVFKLSFPSFQHSLLYDPTAQLLPALDAGFTSGEMNSFLLNGTITPVLQPGSPAKSAAAQPLCGMIAVLAITFAMLLCQLFLQ
eukprot:gene5828-6069_t